MVKRVSRVFTRLSAAAACFATAVLVCLISVDVFRRAFFNSPFSWTIEIATYLMAAIVLFGFAYAEQTGANIRVEVGLGMFKSGWQARFKTMGRWLALSLILLATWQGFEYAFNSYESGQRSWGVLETEMWIPRLVMGPAFLVLSLQLMSAGIYDGAKSVRKRAWMTAGVGLIMLVVLTVATRLQSIALFGTEYPVPLLLIIIFVALMAFSLSFKDGCLYIATLVVLLAWVFFMPKLAVLTQGLTLGVLLCILLFIGLQIGYALGVCAVVGMLSILPSGQLVALPERIWGASTSYELTAVPAFVLMGILLLRSGITNDVFQKLAILLRGVPNGLAYTGVLASGVFATVSGSSMATAATIGKVACPEMLSRDYEPRLVYGCVAAGGTLGILIPPSIALIIYGSVVGVSVSALFMAGLLPGMILLALFLLVIAVWTIIRRPIQVNKNDPAKNAKSAKGENLQVLSFGVLIFLVLGSIYLGLATPTEAGAVGAIGALFLCVATGKFTRDLVRFSLIETVQVTAFLMLIVAFAAVLTYVVDFTKIPRLMIDVMAPLVSEPALLFIGICVVYVILGMFFEPISMMLVTLPIVFPLITAAGFDPVWFGIILVILMEIGLMTPPIGLNLFVVKGVVPSATLSEISLGALPFLLVMFVLLGFLYIWPAVALWLPTVLSGN